MEFNSLFHACVTQFFTHIKQPTIGPISSRFDEQRFICLEFILMYLGGNFLFVRCLYIYIYKLVQYILNLDEALVYRTKNRYA